MDIPEFLMALDAAEAYFHYGRDVAALDVIALTDHGQVDWRGNQLAAPKIQCSWQIYHYPGARSWSSP